MKRISALQLLVGSYFKTSDEAIRWILAGKVYYNNNILAKAGQLIPINSVIRIKDYNKRYVSRGGLKLEYALKNFNLSVKGETVLDAGASTGGFSDCLLQHGARKVFAIDAGYGQLSGKLRIDKRIINLEKTNISDIDSNLLQPKPSIATIDLSYLSLKKSVPIISRLIQPDGKIICLVKPLFEVNDSSIRRCGEIKENKIYSLILEDLIEFFKRLKFTVKGITNSPILGNKKTIEFFMLISLSWKELNQDYMNKLKNEICFSVNKALNIISI